MVYDKLIYKMNSADLLSKLLTVTIIIGYPLMFLVLFASPFWGIKYLRKRKFTPVNVIISIVIGLVLDYGWLKLGILGLSYLGGFAACELYGC